MRPKGWMTWVANLLLFAALVATLPHAHPSGPLHDRDCFACTLSHTLVVPADATPAPLAPRPTGEPVAEAAPTAAPAPLCAVPASRAPPLS